MLDARKESSQHPCPPTTRPEGRFFRPHGRFEPYLAGARIARARSSFVRGGLREAAAIALARDSLGIHAHDLGLPRGAEELRRFHAGRRRGSGGAVPPREGFVPGDRRRVLRLHPDARGGALGAQGRGAGQKAARVPAGVARRASVGPLRRRLPRAPRPHRRGPRARGATPALHGDGDVARARVAPRGLEPRLREGPRGGRSVLDRHRAHLRHRPRHHARELPPQSRGTHRAREGARARGRRESAGRAQALPGRHLRRRRGRHPRLPGDRQSHLLEPQGRGPDRLRVRRGHRHRIPSTASSQTGRRP